MCGGYFPEFFPLTIDQPSPISPSTFRQSPPNSIPATPHQPPKLATPHKPPKLATPHQPPNLKAKTMAFKLRQKKVQQEQVTTTITVEDCDVPITQSKAKRWVNGLTDKDRAVLTQNEWLTDDLINAAQGLLKSQFPHINGLQEVGLGQTLSFAIQTEEFIQILHTGYCHWVTVSTIGCKDGEINIFDSFPVALTSDLMNQIAALLATPKDTIKVKYIDTQMQSGSTDCGIFAVAFATALANGEPPGALIF